MKKKKKRGKEKKKKERERKRVKTIVSGREREREGRWYPNKACLGQSIIWFVKHLQVSNETF